MKNTVKESYAGRLLMSVAETLSPVQLCFLSGLKDVELINLTDVLNASELDEGWFMKFHSFQRLLGNKTKDNSNYIYRRLGSLRNHEKEYMIFAFCNEPYCILVRRFKNFHVCEWEHPAYEFISST